MFSNLGKYLFGESGAEQSAEGTQASPQHVDLHTKEGDLGWLLVDPAPGGVHGEETMQQSGSIMCTCVKDDSHLPSSGLHAFPCPSNHCQELLGEEESSDVGESGSVTPSDCDSHDSHLDLLWERSAFGPRLRTHLGESWIVTPPPCFTGTDSMKGELESNPMENLMIEFPSNEFPLHRLWDTPWVEEAWGVEDSASRPEAEEQDENTPVNNGLWVENVLVHRAAPHEAELKKGSRRSYVAVSVQQMALIEAGQRTKHKAETKPMSRKNIERSNRVQFVQSCGRKHVAQRNRVLRPSGRMNSRNTQRH